MFSCFEERLDLRIFHSAMHCLLELATCLEVLINWPMPTGITIQRNFYKLLTFQLICMAKRAHKIPLCGIQSHGIQRLRTTKLSNEKPYTMLKKINNTKRTHTNFTQSSNRGIFEYC